MILKLRHFCFAVSLNFYDILQTVPLVTFQITRNDRPYDNTILATVLNYLPNFLTFLYLPSIFIPPNMTHRLFVARELFSLNKSKNLSLDLFITTDRLLQHITDSNLPADKTPDKPWRFLPTHQKLSQVQPLLSMLFSRHKSSSFSWPRASSL